MVIRTSTSIRRSANGKFKPGFECKALSRALREAGFASRHFPNRILRHFSLPLISYVTAIGSTSHSTYPAGDGSVANLLSMLPKSRRVR